MHAQPVKFIRQKSPAMNGGADVKADVLLLK
jgi:hypothetical protein